jgi:hypothetical protein
MSINWGGLCAPSVPAVATNCSNGQVTDRAAVISRDHDNTSTSSPAPATVIKNGLICSSTICIDRSCAAYCAGTYHNHTTSGSATACKTISRYTRTVVGGASTAAAAQNQTWGRAWEGCAAKATTDQSRFPRISPHTTKTAVAAAAAAAILII